MNKFSTYTYLLRYIVEKKTATDMWGPTTLKLHSMSDTPASVIRHIIFSLNMCFQNNITLIETLPFRKLQIHGINMFLSTQ